jgi:hypothetical protein
MVLEGIFVMHSSMENAMNILKWSEMTSIVENGGDTTPP